MSNVYIQEPPTHGKVLLETTAGDIDVELWSREAPKACRNFIQLCMEGYYNGTIFHRLVKGFIVQGGDPTGTGQGGNSVWGKPFRDEFHSRLRFSRRGLVGMANAGKDDNGSQFFFTLGPTPELQSKHTLFAKVAGNTIYNMLKLEEGETDEDERPAFPYKITGSKILLNPFEDIVPRESIKSIKSKSRKDDKKETGTKNYKLLSFGEEAEEEEEEISEVNKKFSGRSKSSHDLLTNDPKLSSQVAVDLPPKKSDRKKKRDSGTSASSGSGSDSDSDDGARTEKRRKLEEEGKRLRAVQDKLKKKVPHGEVKKGQSSTAKAEDEDLDAYYLGKDEDLAKKKRIDDLKKEYRQLKSGMRADEEKKVVQKTEEAEAKTAREAKEKAAKDNDLIQGFLKEQEVYKTKTADSKKKGVDREAATLALLQKFQKKLVEVAEVTEVNEPDKDKVEGAEEDDPLWFAKGLSNDDGEEPVVAKDANLKSGDWYSLDDPRNPIVQRRRNEAKRQAQANASSRPIRRDLI